jgi:putative ABC transport system substrate-binding protein
MFRLFTESGGTMRYGPDPGESNERCATTVARILSGANVADLPIERPAKFELIVNMKSAAAMGVTVPESILARADVLLR